MVMKIKVAAVQMVSGPDVDRNLEVADGLLAQAAKQGAKLALLPEYFCLMSGNELGGTVPMRSPKINKVCNSLLVYGPDGRRLARYDKIHLFGFQRGDESYDESVAIHPGRTPVVADVPVDGALLRVGLSVCYDLRFPELYRQMAPLDLMVMPAAFTYTTGQAHWELLLRARAVEGQCYVLASGQGGTHPSGRRTWGHSMLVDPWGEVCAVLPEGEGVVMAEMDTERLASVRESLPALRHRVL